MSKDRYVFSEKAGLLCRVTYKTKYRVINGAWTGTFKDGALKVDDFPETKIKVDDWIDVDPASMPEEWQKAWSFIW